jgi:hypothetical protein
MRGLRRHPVVWAAVVGISAIAISGVVLTPSFSASFLTKRAAKGLFYTKQKSNARYYTKAQADAKFAPADSGGPTSISASAAEWQKSNPTFLAEPNPDPTGTTINYGGEATDQFFEIGADLPTVLNGAPMKLTGMDACYRTTDGANDTTLKNVRIYRFDPETAATGQVFEDQTDRTDDACRSYTLPTPAELQPTDVVYAEYLVGFPGGGFQNFRAGAVTFHLSP